jgi:hypothetical protein
MKKSLELGGGHGPLWPALSSISVRWDQYKSESQIPIRILLFTGIDINQEHG